MGMARLPRTRWSAPDYGPGLIRIPASRSDAGHPGRVTNARERQGRHNEREIRSDQLAVSVDVQQYRAVAGEHPANGLVELS